MQIPPAPAEMMYWSQLGTSNDGCSISCIFVQHSYHSLIMIHLFHGSARKTKTRPKRCGDALCKLTAGQVRPEKLPSATGKSEPWLRNGQCAADTARGLRCWKSSAPYTPVYGEGLCGRGESQHQQPLSWWEVPLGHVWLLAARGCADQGGAL